MTRPASIDGKQGCNSWGEIGFGGPLPPAGSRHRYYFRLLALSMPAGIGDSATKAQLLALVGGRILGEARLMGTYETP